MEGSGSTGMECPAKDDSEWSGEKQNFSISMPTGMAMINRIQIAWRSKSCQAQVHIRKYFSCFSNLFVCLLKLDGSPY